MELLTGGHRDGLVDDGRRIERALDVAVSFAEAPGAPPRLAEAIRYAVVPGRAPHPAAGSASRWRVPAGDDDPATADAAAAAIELLHCASLVHDDLPCFDDAACGARSRRSTSPMASRWRCSPATP